MVGERPYTRRSTTSFCLFLGTSLIRFKSEKQTIVSRSSYEAKYKALNQATCEEKWILYLMQNFNVKHSSPIIIFYDKKSSLYIAKNPLFHERTKHIEIDFHVLRDKLQAEILYLLPIASKDQVTDIVTKSLHTRPFNNLQSKQVIIDLYSILKGVLSMRVKSLVRLLV